MAHAPVVEAEGTRRLRRGSLSIWEAVGISVALMAPSMAANINPQATVPYVGRGVPLAFVLATIGVLLVSYGIVRLCQYYNHAGSVFGFVGVTLGPRAGVLAGWSLIGTYTFYACVTSMAAGIFGSDFLDRIGIWNNHPGWSEFLVAFVALAGAFLLATFPARAATRTLLSIEGITVCLIVVVAVVVLAKLIGGSAPGNQGFTLDVFKPSSGHGIGDVFKASVFGFLSFAGFEAASTLGEETRDPRRSVPRAILGVAVFGGVYFIFVTAVESMGFGTGTAGSAAFHGSGSLLGDLGSTYITSSMGDIVTLGTAISAFGCIIACLVGATRILFALGRDGFGVGLGVVHEQTGTPVRALATVTAGAVLTIAICRIAFTSVAFDVFSWTATIGTLILLVAYLMATLGAMRILWFRGVARAPQWQMIFPALAVLVLVATLYYNIDPRDATRALKWNYGTAAVWVATGAVIVLALPGLARRVGARLAQHEGLRGEETIAPEPLAAGGAAAD